MGNNLVQLPCQHNVVCWPLTPTGLAHGLPMDLTDPAATWPVLNGGFLTTFHVQPSLQDLLASQPRSTDISRNAETLAEEGGKNTMQTVSDDGSTTIGASGPGVSPFNCIGLPVLLQTVTPSTGIFSHSRLVELQQASSTTGTASQTADTAIPNLIANHSAILQLNMPGLWEFIVDTPAPPSTWALFINNHFLGAEQGVAPFFAAQAGESWMTGSSMHHMSMSPTMRMCRVGHPKPHAKHTGQCIPGT